MKKMRKSVLCIIMLSFSILTLSCVNNSIKNDLEKQNLNGNLKSVKENNFFAVDKFGEIVKSEKPMDRIDVSYIFNEKGNKVEETSYHSDGTLYEKKKYRYNEKEILVQCSDYLPNGELDQIFTYNYDENDCLIEENRISTKGELYDRRAFKYDKKNNRIEERGYGYDRSLYYKCVFSYDDKGNLTEENTYDGTTGKLFRKSSYIFDEKSNEIARTDYSLNGSANYEYTFKYVFDNEGNWIKRIQSGYSTEITEREIVYF